MDVFLLLGYVEGHTYNCASWRKKKWFTRLFQEDQLGVIPYGMRRAVLSAYIIMESYKIRFKAFLGIDYNSWVSSTILGYEVAFLVIKYRS